MYKYPKIETVYQRDMDGSKKLMDGVFRSDVVCLELKDGNGERIIVKIKGCDHCDDWASFIKTYK